MKYISYGFLLLWSVLRGWAFLPLAIWQAFKDGGLWRWLGLTFSGMRYQQKKGLQVYTKGMPGDKIHFLNTGGSDAILLESGGRFALIDAAEDSDYPAGRRALAYPGWEAYVLDYVKRAAGDAQGRVTLDFVLGTHAHSDHIGGFDTLITDPDIAIGRAYLKRYEGARMRPYERAYWDNEEVYGQMLRALAARGVPLVRDIPGEPFALGNFQITLFDPGRNRSGDENDSSVGSLVEHSGGRAFLAGDINNISGVEHRLAGRLGKVDLLKAGHHGHNGSGTLAFAAKLRPDTVVFTNKGRASVGVLGRFICAGNTKRLLSTGMFGGLMAVFGEDDIQHYAINEYAVPIPPKAYEEICP